jgi:hypothetical protein
MDTQTTTIQTSVLNDIDYRYGADSELCTQNVQEQFATDDLNLPFKFPINSNVPNN